MWTTSWPGGGQLADLQFYEITPPQNIILTSKNTIKIGISTAPKEFQEKTNTTITHLFTHPLRKKKHLRVRRGHLADLQLFFFCFFLSFCVWVLFFFFFCFSSFCFFSLFLLLLLLLVLVVLLDLLVFVVLLFVFSSYYYVFFFFFFLLFIFICFIFLFFLFFLWFFFLLIYQKDRQKRQTGFIIDGKHSNILVFLYFSWSKRKSSNITQTLIRFHKKKKTLKTWNVKQSFSWFWSLICVFFADASLFVVLLLLILFFLFFFFFVLSFFLYLWLSYSASLI